METKSKHWSLRILKWSSITLATILLLMYVLPILFPGYLTSQVQKFANDRLEGKLSFSEIELSFFTQFPSLTVTLYDVQLNGSQPFADQNLLKADAVGFGIDLKDLIFSGEVTVNELFIDDSSINVIVDENGRANYNVYKTTEQVSTSSDTASSASLRLNRIAITHCDLQYEDRSLPMVIQAKDFNYVGKGNLDEAVFDLETHAQIAAFDFTFDGKKYFENKQVNAKLITQINTDALRFAFRQNELTINSLPVNFIGEFHILQSGYYMDFNLKSDKAPLRSLFTALPPNYVRWVDRSEVRGELDLFFQLKGRYEVESQSQPSIVFRSKISNGYIAYNESANPTRDLTLDLNLQLPHLNTDSLKVDLKKLYFAVGERNFLAQGQVSGLNTPHINAEAKGYLDLEHLGKSLQLNDYTLRGQFNVDAQMNGLLDLDNDVFPKTQGHIVMKNAHIQTPYYPAPLEQFNLNVELRNSSGKFSQTYLKLEPVSWVFEGEPFHAQGYFKDPGNVQYDFKAKGVLNLTNIAKVFAPEDIGIQGKVKADVALKGSQADLVAQRFDRLQNAGGLEADSLRIKIAMLPKPMFLDRGVFRFEQDKMRFDQFKARYASSALEADGYINDMIGYLFTPKATLRGDFTLKMDQLIAEEWMPEVDSTAVATHLPTAEISEPTAEVFAIPQRIDLRIQARVDQLQWQDIAMRNARGELRLKEEKAILNKLQLTMIDAPMQLQGYYRAVSPTQAEFAMQYKANSFDVQRAYKEIALFRELASAAQYASGVIGMDYSLKGTLNSEMLPEFSTLVGGGAILLKDVKVAGMKMFNRVTEKTDLDVLDNPNFKEVTVESNIRNNVISIERTKISLGLFRLRLEGKTNFDGAMAFQMRIGLPPFGLIGIPVTINGTHENPQVNVFSKKTDEVPEKGYGKEADQQYEDYLEQQAIEAAAAAATEQHVGTLPTAGSQEIQATPEQKEEQQPTTPE